MSRMSATIGVLYRRSFRRLLQRSGLSYTEDKGLLDSQFTITGPGDRLLRLAKILKEIDT